MSHHRTGPLVPLVLAVALLVGACGSGDDTDGASADESEPIAATDCLIRLHGKGDSGGPSSVVDGLGIIQPTGNADGWGDRQWLYADGDDLDEATAIVADAIEGVGCTAVVVHGFSNGGAMAAAMYCAGEDLDQRVVGYIVDDPVTDLSSADCSPAAAVDVVLYWTGALDEAAPPGTDCDSIDWTCAGPTVRGIEAFASDLGITHQASIHDEHVRYDDPPQIAAWLGR